MKLLYPMIAAAGLLAACSAEAPPVGNESAEQPAVAAMPPPTAALSVEAPAGAALGVVTKAAAAKLTGELRCAFTDEDGAVRFTGAGDVDKASRATAVVIRKGAAVLLDAAVAGGFDAMREGGRFVSDQLTITVTRGATQDTGHEGSRNAAKLNVEQRDAATSSIDGLWECGP